MSEQPISANFIGPVGRHSPSTAPQKLRARAESYDQSGESAAHTAALLRDAAAYIETLEGVLAGEIRRAEDAHGQSLFQSLYIKKLEAVRDAARTVNDDSGPDLAPPLGSMAKLADALHQEWKWRKEVEADGDRNV